jgi:hypothetical protein
LLGGYLPSVELIPVFKHLFCIQPIDKLILLERLLDSLGSVKFFRSNSSSSIADLGVRSLDGTIWGDFFKLFSSKYFIETVTKLFPLDIICFLFASESLAYLLEFRLRERELSHVHCQSELFLRNISMPEFIEISHELRYSDSFLFDCSSES